MIKNNKAYIIFDISEIKGKSVKEVTKKAEKAVKALYVKINGGCGCV